MARIENYEIYQKILEQISSIKLGSAENLIGDFYKRINTDPIYFNQIVLKNKITLSQLLSKPLMITLLQISIPNFKISNIQ
jgi:hypothetical protein